MTETQQAAAPRILVIDDDQSLLRSIRLSLFLEGYLVETAVDGIDGLEQVEASEIDLVILDLQMPRMDGRSFFREIRSRGYDMPVLILSAYGADGARDELQAEAAIGKPFDPAFLVDKIKSLLPEPSNDDGQSGP
jgi:DNA-binding response OmpR family regulator